MPSMTTATANPEGLISTVPDPEHVEHGLLSRVYLFFP